MKTFKITGRCLDYAVAKAQKISMQWDEVREDYALGVESDLCWLSEYSPSTNWSQAGKIITKERITISQGRDMMASIWVEDYCGCSGYKFKQTGPSPLVAAMRTYVASTLGNEVDIPDGLE